jgi:hypothetical protein
MVLTTLKTISTTLRNILKYGVPSYIICFGDSLGDNLLITTLCEALVEHGQGNIWVKCDHAFLFENNPGVKLVIPFNTLLSTAVLKIFKAKTVYLNYTTYSPSTDRDEVPEKHIILKMADGLGFKGELTNKPVLYLTPDEERKGYITSKQIVIATSTAGAKFPMRNKEWMVESYQAIVDRFSDSYRFIQLGAKNDFSLSNVIDLRGKTTIRESAAILKASLLVITHVGFLMHLARAVDCRAVVIYGGREKPEQSGYACFENLYTNIECSPCWQHNRCDFSRRCMTQISTDMVAQAVLNQLKHYHIPLTAEKLFNA